MKSKPKLRLTPLEPAGFIPLLILILLIVACLIYLVYTRVLHAQK